jgi:hypothetical protein
MEQTWQRPAGGVVEVRTIFGCDCRSLPDPFPDSFLQQPLWKIHHQTITMQGFSAARRAKPKIVRSGDDDDDNDSDNRAIEEVTSATESIDLETPPVPSIKQRPRPATTKRAGSKLKLSFGADEVCPLPSE